MGDRRIICDPIPTVRVGFVGLGRRGPDAVRRFTYIPNSEIKALCDMRPECISPVQEMLRERGVAPAIELSDWKELCRREDIDLVYIATPWHLHAQMAVYAMEHGKHVAVEAPAAMTVEECWSLVETAERTQRHCTMLENCCYDPQRLNAIQMAREGVLGEITHAEGGYTHQLDEYWCMFQDAWRQKMNREHRGDLYPSHGLGPIALALGIHRTDRMISLVSMDSAPFHGKEIGDFVNGDNTCTIIRTERGKTIYLHHNICNPAPLRVPFNLYGTLGFVGTSGVAGTAEGCKVTHPLLKDEKLCAAATKVGGHGGMDFLMDWSLVHCLHEGLPLDIDVYDAAGWSCIVELSERSILSGSKPVEIPDFTSPRRI